MRFHRSDSLVIDAQQRTHTIPAKSFNTISSIQFGKRSARESLISCSPNDWNWRSSKSSGLLKKNRSNEHNELVFSNVVI